MKTLATSSIDRAAREIKSGGIVAFPTETVYGLGANAFDENAVRKIFIAKKRPSDNPLIVHIWNKEQLFDVSSEISPKTLALVERFFPGPLSVLVKKSASIPDIVTAGLPTVSVRMPSSPIALRFLKACGVPVAAPSANLSGKPSSTSWKHVLQDLDGRIPVVLKGPNSKFGLESTVINCTRDPPVILRPGAIPLEEIEKVIGKVVVPVKLRRTLSPGMAHRHYSPKARIVLVDSVNEVPKKLKESAACIGFEECHNADFSAVPENYTEYARILYDFLRTCDERNVKVIYAEKPLDKKGISRALYDRLIRAAAGK